MKFSLSDEVYRKNIEVMKALTQEQRAIARKAGTDNPQFEYAWANLFNLLKSNRFDQFRIQNRFDVRALSLAMSAQEKLRRAITIDKKLLDDVSTMLPMGSNLFIEALFQFFLSDFSLISDPDAIGSWLYQERQRKGLTQEGEQRILCADGPTYVAKTAIERGTDFDKQVQLLKIDNYASGDFIKQAKSVYFVEQLQQIPANQPHALLEEISKENVANSRYDAEELIGHVALRILIERAPTQGVHESWQNAVIAIAGDPRVPRNHSRFIKWWSQVNQRQIRKVQSWLSKLDLKLFLEALEDYSKSSNDSDMMRMFPARKHFLEGMHQAGTITHTKLYLSRKADRYIRENYKPEHVPDYSLVEDGERSIIYAELTNGHMIEGSHNCQIWFYKSLHESAPVLEYGRQRLKYEDLTGRLSRQMYAKGCSVFEHFTHVSSETLRWQHKSVDALQRMGVKIRASNVLSEDDYKKYKRLYGVG